MSTLARKIDTPPPAPPAPTEQEIAEATARSRREDGTLDPYELALQLAVPMGGRIRSDDPHFRFASDDD